MEKLKKERIEALNKEFEDKKKELVEGSKGKQIEEASQKLV